MCESGPSIPRPTRTQALRCGSTFAFATAFFFIHLYSSVCSACNVPPDAGLQKKANFSELIERTGDQTRAICGAGSDNNRSAIHYDSIDWFTYPPLLIIHTTKFRKTLYGWEGHIAITASRNLLHYLQ
jgi:hypothetical protein